MLLFSSIHSLPALVVFVIKPPEPTIQPVLSSTKKVDHRSLASGTGFWLVHLYNMQLNKDIWSLLISS